MSSNRQSDVRIRVPVEHAADAVFELDARGRIQRCNRAAETMFGYAEGELRGYELCCLVPALPTSELKSTAAESGCFTEGSFCPQTRAWRRSDALLWVDVHVTQSSAEQDTIFTAVLKDVTDRVEALDALQRRDARLRAIFDSTADAIVTTDAFGRITELNEAAEHLFGCGSGELTGRRITELLPPAHRDTCAKDLANYFDAGELGILGRRRETVGHRLDGRTFPMDLCARALESEHDGLTIVFRDLTEQRKLERDLRRAQKMEAVGRLASGMAHDFNNLLVGVLGSADMALDLLDEDHPAREHVEALRNATQKHSAIVSQLTRFDTSEQSLPEPTSLRAEVQRAIPMIKLLLGEEIHVDLDMRDPGHLVRVASNEVEQIMMNLVANAREAMAAEGQVNVRITEVELAAEDTEWSATLTPGSYLTLEVADSGHGMESAVEARVFDPFFSTKEAEDNRGLGMTTVYAIARKRGGDAELVSRPGQGTTVRLLLPIAKRAPTRTQSRGQAVAQCRGTILVVEDDALVRTSIRHYLRRAGYQVLEARTAADALRIYRNQSGEVDLVLTDVVLPGMSGPHLRRRLQQLLPKPPVVLVSAYPEEKLRQRPDFDPGASVLPKPFSEKQLLEAVEAELPVKRSA